VKGAVFVVAAGFLAATMPFGAPSPPCVNPGVEYDKITID
jgi:hypothetical protein